MNRARQMLKLALAKSASNRLPDQQNRGKYIGARASVSSSSEARAQTSGFNSDLSGLDDEMLVPVVADEKSSNVSCSKISSEWEVMSDESFQEDSDDSVKDPDFRMPESPSREIFSESEIDDMARQIEENLSSDNRDEENFDRSPEKTEPNETRKGRNLKRNLGMPYKTKSGKDVAARKMKPLADCKRKCNEKFLLADQEAIFKQYWALGNYNMKLAFVSGLISIGEKKTTRSKTNLKAVRNRQYTYSYFLQLKGIRTQVCQKCFKLTLCETDRFLKTVIAKKIESTGTVTMKDMRGSSTPSNKISSTKIREVVDHINSIPAYESHYTRKHSSQRYFDSNLSLSLLYKLYTEKTENPISITKYTEIFNGLNIKFKKPKVDTCTKCDTLAIRKSVATGIDLLNILSEQRDHHVETDFAYDSKKRDIAAAKNSSTLKVFTFDLQQCLPTPYLQSSVSFYKRQLNTFNLTVHDCSQGIPHCYMWHEGVANRGGNEVASCLFQHLRDLSVTCPRADHAVFYSDNCFGQNKNKFVAVMMLMHVCGDNNVLQHIDHKFLIPGHTHMECDIDHSIIERKKKKSLFQIHHPRDWYQFVRGVGLKNKFIVEEMSRTNFWDFGKIANTKYIFRKVDNENNKVNWTKIRWLRFSRETPNLIHYKNSLDENEPFRVINIQKRRSCQAKEEGLQLAYDGPNKISEAKKQDLINLLPLIDEQFHDFYKNLCTESKPDFHPDLTEEVEQE